MARAEEALLLRANGITQPLLVLEGFFSLAEAQALAEHNIAATLHSEQQLTDLETVRLARPLG